MNNTTVNNIDEHFAAIQKIVNELSKPKNFSESASIEFDNMQKDIIVSCMDLNMYIDNFIDKISEMNKQV